MNYVKVLEITRYIEQGCQYENPVSKTVAKSPIVGAGYEYFILRRPNIL
jgi:hypothetical protein